ncbi:MAG: peptide chain release factor N(5)-glutamine methyltransferase [Prosthecochloris sp.]|nr:peptide chain release factor N(5)-glutamine methyltransferase [Prosthecochloris sp.]
MVESRKQWKTIELLKTTAAFFEEKGVSEARLSAELLLAHVLKLERLQLYLQHDRPVFGSELELFRELCRKRLQAWPVQYLTGEQFFLGRRFAVDPRVLIPRPETELLVEYAVEALASAAAPSVLDVGTGSGCIAVSVALAIPDAEVTAVDVSSCALDVARQNARMHGVLDRIRFFQADMFSSRFVQSVSSRFDAVLSNPPYIPESEWDELQTEVRRYEPRQALTTAGGTECYNVLAGLGPLLLLPGGMLWLELHADAADEVCRILSREGFERISVFKDYSGHDRIAFGCRNAAHGTSGSEIY